MEELVLAVGDIVHYVLATGRSRGRHVPAIITKVWSRNESHSGVNLHLFCDGANDHPEQETTWRTSVPFDRSGKPGTFHIPSPEHRVKSEQEQRCEQSELRGAFGSASSSGSLTIKIEPADRPD